MDNRTTKFKGRNGTMLIGPDGITIKRNTQQAMQAGTRRTTTLRYQDLAEIKHRRASLRPGTLQLNMKEGVEGVTPLNRITKIGYDRTSTHKFRRARDIINSHMTKYNNQTAPAPESRDSEITPSLYPSEDSGSGDVPMSSPGLPFRR